MFSCLISVYINDDPAHFSSALDSILNQTYKEFEVVLVCDGALNGELENVIESFNGKCKNLEIEITIVRLPSNVGLGKALQIGVNHCTRNFIVRMDSDDLSVVDRFEHLKGFIEANPDYAVYGGQISEFYHQPNDSGRSRSVPLSQEAIVKYSKLRNPMNHVTVCIDKRMLECVGNYEGVIYHEDYFLWLKMIDSEELLINTDKVLVHVRVGNDLIGRRIGLSYFKHELFFLKLCFQRGYFSWFESIVYFFSRLSVRFLPKTVLERIYARLRA